MLGEFRDEVQGIEWLEVAGDAARVITGTMGRFPTFRETGWRILRTAQIVGE